MTDERGPADTAVHNYAPVGTQIIATGPTTVVVATPLTWERVLFESRAWEADISSDLAGRVSLVRGSIAAELRGSLERSRISVVLGESGAGKSAIVRRAIAHFAEPARVTLYASDAVDFERSRAPALSSLLTTPPETSGVVVLDAIDRIDDGERMRALARLIRALGVDRPGEWSLVLTCGRVAWPRIASELGALGVTWSSPPLLAVSRLTGDELEIAAAVFPALAPLLSRVELRPLLAQAKVLDLLARASIDGSLPASTGWIGESDVVAWFSETYVRPLNGDVSQAALLQRLARDQADSRLFATPLADLGVDSAPLPPLVAQGVLVLRDEVVRFAHDLFADYARARWLVGEVRAGRWDSVRQRIGRRLWHRGLYLLCADALERPNPSHPKVRDAWITLRGVLGSAEPDAATDLLLEASSLSSAAARVLPAIEPELFAEGGGLLRRMLTHFLFNASFPHPGVLAVLSGKSRRAQLLAEAAYRLPDPLPWAPVLRWLLGIAPRAIAVARDETFSIAETWLLPFRQIPSWPFLSELAEVVLTIAEQEEGPRYRHRDERRRLFLVLLAVAPLTDRSRCDRVLRARAGLVRPPSPPEPDAGADVKPELRYLLRSVIPMELVGPWPGGPSIDPDGDFAAVALADPGATSLVDYDAKLARELFSALLISPPHERDPHDLYRRDAELREIEETKPTRDFPPIRALLEADAATGLALTNALLNFATDRWREMAERRTGHRLPGDDDVLGVEIAMPTGHRLYGGNQKVFFWNLGFGPNAACAAALTLEEWLTKHALNGTLKTEWLTTLLEASHSAAMLGVLLDIGLLQPDLLEATTLEPLGTSPLLALWSSQRQSQLQIDRPWIVAARERPHLSRALLELVVPIFLRREFVWPALEQSRRRWQALLEQIPCELRDYVESWLDLLDPARWTPSPDSEFGYVYQESESLTARRVPEAAAAQGRLILLGLPHRCQDVIEGRVTWTEAQLTQLLRALASPLAIDRDIEDLVGGSLALRCEVAAVALLRFDRWLAQNREEQAGCVGWLLAPLEQDVVPGMVFARDDVTTASWDVFCAQALPGLLAGAPTEPRLRRGLGRLIAFPHDVALRIAIRGARKVLTSDDFSSLLHLNVRVARRVVLRHLAAFGRHSVAALDRDDDDDLEAFVEGRLARLPANWRRFADEWPKGFERRFRQHPHAHGFEEEMTFATFAWLDDELRGANALDHIELVAQLSAPLLRRLSGPWKPPFSTRRTVAETAEKVARALRKKTLADRLRANAERWHPEGPFPSDEIPIVWTATLILRAEKTEVRSRLWKPWLRLPLESDFWIERLFEQLYRQGLDPENADGRQFAGVLNEILVFIETEGWLGTARHAAAFKVVMAAFGRGHVIAPSARWARSRTDVAEAIAGHLAVFVERAHDWPGCFEFACDLLLAPAFEAQQLRALAWLARSATDELLSDDDAADALTHLLDAISQRPREELAAAPEAQAHFDHLLGVLERRQHRIALALARRIARERDS